MISLTQTRNMNNLEKIYKESGNFKDFSKSYLSYMSDLLKSLDHVSIESFLKELEVARQQGNTIFIAGNGGSASTASHISMDLGQIMFKLPSFSPPFKAVSLTDNLSTITAVGNDFSYEEVFTKQIQMQYRERDILVVISASGSSPNVVNAAKWVKQHGGKVLGLLGFDGGKLKEICDVSVIVNTPKEEYGPVEDLHLILNHLFFAWFYYSHR
jgi:D-sedoheptulose 7-phosphate isomerase